MTARNDAADWHGDVEGGAGTVTVGDGFFEGAYSYQSRCRNSRDRRDSETG
jgi:hypothetical protein